MADGSVTINVELDAKNTQNDIDSLKKEINGLTADLSKKNKDIDTAVKRRDKLYADLEKRVSEYNAAQEKTQEAIDAQLPITSAIEETRQKIKEAETEVKKYKQEWLSGVSGADSNQSKAQETLSNLQQNLIDLKSEAQKYDASIERAAETEKAAKIAMEEIEVAAVNAKHNVRNLQEDAEKLSSNLESAKGQAGDLEKKLATAGYDAEKMNEGTKKAGKSADLFAKRIKSVVRSALVFTVITQALSKLRNWVGDVIKTSPEAAAAIAQLKGALLTMVQPLVDVIIPAFTALVQVLTAVVAKIAQFVASISGKSLAASTESAKALNNQTKALKGTGKAAKDASKSLASFDEINKLSGTSDNSGSGADSESIAPNFDFLDGVSDRLKNIATAVALIGTGLALWKVSDSLPGNLGLIATKLGGIAIAAGGLALMWDGLKDAWENGIDWTNFLEILAGAGALVGGLALAFGKVGAGIGLVVAGAALIVTAFHDMEENGINLKNVLMLITGILSAGLGISILTGSWVPLMIAAIAGIVVAMLAWTGNLGEFIDSIKGIFSGLIDFITGVFSGDLDKAFNGLKKMLKSLINADIIIVESFINTIIRAVNWLISQLNKIHFELPDWVPGIGGLSFGVNIPAINEKKLPRLATGAVIPPNREFLAVLGDQKQGTNIETPLPTMIQAFKQALAEIGYNGSNEAVLVLDREVLGKVVYKLNKAENKRIGVNLAGV